jgi:hypothetical protein
LALEVVDTVSHVLFSTGRCIDVNSLFLVDKQLCMVNNDVFDPEELEAPRPLVLFFSRVVWLLLSLLG